jgi:hypothetical protein
MKIVRAIQANNYNCLRIISHCSFGLLLVMPYQTQTSLGHMIPSSASSGRTIPPACLLVSNLRPSDR